MPDEQKQLEDGKQLRSLASRLLTALKDRERADREVKFLQEEIARKIGWGTYG